MNCKLFLPCCFIILLVSSASPLFPNDSKRVVENNFVMYIEEEWYGYSPNAIRTTEGSYVSITEGDTVRKISESGQILWQQTLLFTTSYGQYVWLDGIAETNQGYILFGGTYDWDDIPVSAVIVKLGMDGNVEWNKTFQSSREFYFNSVFSTADGGYIVHGNIWGNTRNSATALVKLTSNGDIVWSKIFDDLPHLCVSHPVSDGVILASTRGPLRILKVNDSGSIVWVKSLQTNGFHLHSMGPSSDNGVIIAGNSSNRVTLVQISKDGNVHWNAAYLLKDAMFYISSVASTADHGYVVSGTRYSGENAGGFVIKLDSKQELVFHKKFGRNDRDEYAGRIFASADGGYRIFGSSRSHTLFLSVNSEGMVPGCSFFDNLSVKKVSSPVVRNQNREMASRNFILSAGSIEISQTISSSSYFTGCH